MALFDLMTVRGLEPRIFALKGRRVSQFHYTALHARQFKSPKEFEGLEPSKISRKQNLFNQKVSC